MAIHKSALKRAKQNKIRRFRNMGCKTRIKTALKEFETAIADSSKERSGESLRKVVSLLQKTASRGVIHKKNASRKISRLTQRVNKLGLP